MTRKYFGTDGVRGRVGESPITPELVMHLGYAAGKVLAGTDRRAAGGDPPAVLIGKDTRISGYMLESALQAGRTAYSHKLIPDSDLEKMLKKRGDDSSGRQFALLAIPIPTAFPTWRSAAEYELRVSGGIYARRNGACPVRSTNRSATTITAPAKCWFASDEIASNVAFQSRLD